MARVTFNAKLFFVNKSILPPEQNIAEGIVAPASSYNNSIIILNTYTRYERICVATPHTDQRVRLVHTDHCAFVMRHNSSQLCIRNKTRVTVASDFFIVSSTCTPACELFQG